MHNDSVIVKKKCVWERIRYVDEYECRKLRKERTGRKKSAEKGRGVTRLNSADIYREMKIDTEKNK